jgi:hypothetical protein
VVTSTAQGGRIMDYRVFPSSFISQIAEKLLSVIGNTNTTASQTEVSNTQIELKKK